MEEHISLCQQVLRINSPTQANCMQYISTVNMLCSPDAAMLQNWTDIAASFDQYSFSEAGHVQLNVLEDR